MDTFTTALKHENEVNQGRRDCQEDALSQAVVMARALNELGPRIVGKGEEALRRQRRYMLTNLPTIEVPVQEYCDRLLQMSMCLQFFPDETINIIELNPSPFPRTFSESELMEALEHAAPDDWKAELKKQHITNFNSLNDMKWRYKDIQDAGKDLARSNRHGRGNTSMEDNESQLPRNRQSRSRSRKCKGAAIKRAGGTTVIATNVRMAANIAAEDMTAKIAGSYQRIRTSAPIGGGPLTREGTQTISPIEASTTRRKRMNSPTRLNCPRKPSLT
jgi:hypothetical protein